MELRDVIFQGVWGREKAARLTLESGALDTIDTPPDVDVGQVVDVLVALLYPDSDDGRTTSWLKAAGSAARLGLIIDKGDRTYRLLRAASPESLRIQKQVGEGYELEAKRVEPVSRILDDDLGRPPLGEFLALNCWAFDRASQQLTMRVSETHEFSRAERRTLEAYRRAKRAETLEDELASLNEEREQLREKWGEVFEREDELKSAKQQLEALESDRLGADQLELLRHKDSRVERLERKLDEIEGRESSTRRAMEETEPTPPWRDTVFWTGIAAAIVAVGVGIWLEESHRWIMLLDAVGFGVALFVALRYLTRLEQQGVQNVRLESSRRRARELRQELVDVQERVDHILTHAEADSERELIEKNERAEKIERMIRELEDELSDIQQDREYNEDRDRLGELDRQIQMKSAELDDLRGSTPPVFELENQLHDMGINPKAGLERLEAHRSGSGAPESRHTDVLRRTCEDLDLIEDGQLTDGRLCNMWQKVCGHVLGEPFGHVVLVDGNLELATGAEANIDELAPVGSVERRQIHCALAFGAHAATPGRTPGVATLWVPHPRHFGPDANIGGWQQVLRQAGGSFGVAMLR